MQSGPASVSVQAVIAVADASEPIVAPAIGRVPPGSLLIAIRALSKAVRATFVSLESYSSPGSASRRKIAARCSSPSAFQLRLALPSVPVVIAPLVKFCGAASGCTGTTVPKKPAAKRRGSKPVSWTESTR